MAYVIHFDPALETWCWSAAVDNSAQLVLGELKCVLSFFLVIFLDTACHSFYSFLS